MPSYRIKPPGSPRLRRSHPLAHGLVAAWLSGGTNVLADRVGSNSVTLTKTAAGAGPRGSLDYYDGTAYGVAAAPIDFDRTAPFSVAATCSFDAFGSYDVILSTLDVNNGYRGWEVMKQNSSTQDRLCFFLISSYPSSAIEAYYQPPTAGAVFRLMFTYDGGAIAAGVHCYGDGVPIAFSSTLQNNLSGGSTRSGIPVQVGRRTNGSYLHQGKIGDVLIWNRCLSPAEVAADAVDPVAMFRTRRPIFLAPIGAATIAPTAINSTAVVGTPALAAGAVTVTPSAIGSATLVGAPSLVSGAVTVTPAAIGSATLVGMPALASGAVTISPLGVLSDAVVGIPTFGTTPGGLNVYSDAFCPRLART